MGRRKATLVLGVLVAALVLTSRLASVAAVDVTTEAGPADMVGRWSASWPDGQAKGQPAAEIAISLTPNGPDVVLTMYRYRAGAEGKLEGKPDVQTLPATEHSVKNGVLRFRTRIEDFRIRREDPPAPMDADWEFAVVGPDVGKLTLVRNSKMAADKAAGKDVPPPPPPLAMKRVSKP